jgi:hypothetical protein
MRRHGGGGDTVLRLPTRNGLDVLTQAIRTALPGARSGSHAVAVVDPVALTAAEVVPRCGPDGDW